VIKLKDAGERQKLSRKREGKKKRPESRKNTVRKKEERSEKEELIRLFQYRAQHQQEKTTTEQK